MARRNRDYIGDDGKEVWNELMKIRSFGYSANTIFPDWLDLILNSLCSLTENINRPDLIQRLRENRLEGKYEDQYLQIIQRYRENQTRRRGERPIDYFTEAWSVLSRETREKERDILGEIYQSGISYGEHGQFMTPSNVSEVMARMISGRTMERTTINDPCCGSGRLLINMSKYHPDAFYVGQDIDDRCVKMAAINAWLFDLNADLIHGNTLLNERRLIISIRKGGYIFQTIPEVDESETHSNYESKPSPRPEQTEFDML